MSNMGDPSPRPSGFMANIRAAYTPRPLTEEEAQAPLVMPRTVRTAGWLAIAGALLVILGSLVVFASLDSAIAEAKAVDVENVSICNERVGGVGVLVTATPAAEDADLAGKCRNYAAPTQSDFDGYRNALMIAAIVFLVLAVAQLWAGWNLAKGAFWARRMATVVTLVFAIAVFLNVTSTVFSLVGTLLMVAASMMMYIGMAGRYFVRVRASQSR